MSNQSKPEYLLQSHDSGLYLTFNGEGWTSQVSVAAHFTQEAIDCIKPQLYDSGVTQIDIGEWVNCRIVRLDAPRGLQANELLRDLKSRDEERYTNLTNRYPTFFDKDGNFVPYHWLKEGADFWETSEFDGVFESTADLLAELSKPGLTFTIDQTSGWWGFFTTE